MLPEEDAERVRRGPKQEVWSAAAPPLRLTNERLGSNPLQVCNSSLLPLLTLAIDLYCQRFLASMKARGSEFGSLHSELFRTRPPK
jgi:hypothetical protein